MDTGSPVSFLNWSTTKKIIDKSKKAQFNRKVKPGGTIYGLQQTTYLFSGDFQDKSSVSWLRCETGHVFGDRTKNQMYNGSGPSSTSGDNNHT